MKPSKPSEVERHIQECVEQGDSSRAVELALSYCRAQIQIWLRTILPAETDANDAFSLFCEDLWKGLPGFRWESAFMTWAYRLAHNAAFRHARRTIREQPTDHLPAVAAPGERSRTAPWIRSDVKSRFKRLREQLEPRDRMVLMLRVDRGMAWEDIVQIVAEDGELSKDELRRAASALRQHFQRVKARLHELAAAEGMLRSTV